MAVKSRAPTAKKISPYGTRIENLIAYISQEAFMVESTSLYLPWRGGLVGAKLPVSVGKGSDSGSSSPLKYSFVHQRKKIATNKRTTITVIKIFRSLSRWCLNGPQSSMRGYISLPLNLTDLLLMCFVPTRWVGMQKAPSNNRPKRQHYIIFCTLNQILRDK